MKRLTKKGNLTGKKIIFLEDVQYATEKEFTDRTISGIEYQGVSIDSMIQDEIIEMIEYLISIGFVKGDNVIIPAGTEATIIYDNSGNDVDLKINDKLTLVLANDFSFNENANEESIKAEIIE